MHASIANVAESERATDYVESFDDCPLCCSEMTLGDVRYPLYCPTVTCSYNFCSDCIRRFMSAESDGYQVASDGSKQLKIVVRCPMCRSKYQSETPPANKYSSEVIIQSVLMLRNAVFLEKLFSTPDCELSASDLSKKTHFLTYTTMEQLEDAYARLQMYQGSLLSPPDISSNINNKKNILQRKNDEQANSLRLVPLDWKLYRSVLVEKRSLINGKSPSSDENDSLSHETNQCIGVTTDNNHAVQWKDPTLFGGMEEFMSVSEHEFLSKMMISGQCEMIACAATILQGIMEVSFSRRAESMLQQACGSFDSNEPQRQLSPSSRPVKLSSKMIEHMHRVRKRFPLPINMPRCVSIPIYDPLVTRPKPLLDFSADPSTKQTNLKLKSINGYAGRVGLRKGDLVTHVDGNAVETFDEFVTAMQKQSMICDSSKVESSETPCVQIIVNATQEAANALQERYQEMVKNNIRFHY